MRSLQALPKAHLHLHLTGGMRHETLVELADAQGVLLPHGLLDPGSVDLDATGLRGWLKFQRLYDQARNLLRGPDEVRRVVAEIVEDQARDGVGWLELQVDPSTYAPRLGGLQAAVEVVLDALQALPHDCVVFTHYIAINVAAGAAQRREEVSEDGLAAPRREPHALVDRDAVGH